MLSLPDACPIYKEYGVRFCVVGAGLFAVHVGDRVYEIERVKDDLIAVPDGTTHWFDMGPEPSCVAIGFFTETDGWVGHFTGTDIAQKFPRYGKAGIRDQGLGIGAKGHPLFPTPTHESPFPTTGIAAGTVSVDKSGWNMVGGVS